MGRITKRLPWGKKENHPNCGDMKGRRLYVRGTCGEVKRKLDAAGVTYKKVRLSGFPGIVEIVYTQQGRESPFGVFCYDKENPLASTYSYYRRRPKKGCHIRRWPKVQR